MIVGAQIRAGRAALNWSIDELADRSRVSARTIIRFEAVDGLPPGRTQTLSEVEAALVAGGIEFIGSPDDDPGIRLRLKRPQRVVSTQKVGPVLK